MLEGCAFSAIGLHCLTTVWAECVRAKTETVPRTCADDISSTARRLTAQVLQEELRKVHTETQTYARLRGGVISLQKTYSFCSDVARGAIPGIAHKPALRIVGSPVCAVDARAEATAPHLLQARAATFEKTIQRAHKLPGDFEVRAQAIRERVTMCTYAYGSCPISTDLTTTLGKLNTDIQAAVWRTTKNAYLAPPDLTLKLVVSPSLDVQLASATEALLALARDPQVRRPCVDQYTNNVRFGPAARLRQLARHPVHSHFARELIQHPDDELDVGNFAHCHREAWREQRWRELARRRPGAYRGLEDPIDRPGALCYYEWMLKEARRYQKQLDRHHAHETLDKKDDPRYRLAIIRALLHGSMWTEDRETRHFKRAAQQRRCRCGAIGTVLHISWECHLYAHERRKAIHALPKQVVEYLLPHATASTSTPSGMYTNPSRMSGSHAPRTGTTKTPPSRHYRLHHRDHPQHQGQHSPPPQKAPPPGYCRRPPPSRRRIS